MSGTATSRSRAAARADDEHLGGVRGSHEHLGGLTVEERPCDVEVGILFGQALFGDDELVRTLIDEAFEVGGARQPFGADDRRRDNGDDVQR